MQKSVYLGSVPYVDNVSNEFPHWKIIGLYMHKRLENLPFYQKDGSMDFNLEPVEIIHWLNDQNILYSFHLQPEQSPVRIDIKIKVYSYVN